MGEIGHDNLYSNAKKIDELKVTQRLPFTSKKMIRELYRIISLLFLLVFLVFYFDNPNFHKEGLFSNLFFPLVLFALLLFFCFYHFTKNIDLGIEFFEDRFTYPYLYLWKKSVNFCNVFSIENIFFRGDCVSYVVGEISGNSIFIMKERFENENDFHAFRRAMDELVKINKSAGVKARRIFVDERKKLNLVVQLLIIFLWVAVLACLSLSSNIEYFHALELGALTKNVKEGEGFYRIASSFFSHVNVFHLLSNMLAFAVMAESLLRLLDTYRFLSVLLISALLSSLTSLYLSPHEHVIGASGGVFGLFGAYCVVKFMKDLPGTVSLRSNKMVLFILVIQIATEYFIEGVDSYSHGGGVFAGALLMAVYLYFSRTQSIFKSTRTEKVLAVSLSAAYLWGLGDFLLRVYA